MPTSDLDGLPGWTADETYLQSAEIWTSDGDGAEMAQERGISLPCTSVMCSSPESGDGMYMFMDSANVVYFWNRLADTVWKITSPTDKAAILAMMKSNPAGLKMDEMPVSTATPDATD